MTIAKVRALSQYGVVTDVDPYNLPLNAWSMAVNARFNGASVLRARVFRGVASVASLTANFPSSGFDRLHWLPQWPRHQIRVRHGDPFR
jgi:hypothetical protein